MHKLLLWVQGTLVPVLGMPGLFAVAFLDSSFLSLPEINDVMIASLAAAEPRRAWLAVLMTTLGSLAGCLVLRELGRRGGEGLMVRQFGAERVARSRAAFQRWDVLALGVPAILPPPMPFKIFVLSAGVFGFPLRRFVITLAVARGLRYGFWAILGAYYGERGLAWVQWVDRWFEERGLLLLGVAAALTVLLVALMAWRRRLARQRAEGAG